MITVPANRRHPVHSLNKASGPRRPSEDQEALAVEAGCFRASLLWFLAFGGGLARNQDGGLQWCVQDQGRSLLTSKVVYKL